MQRGLTALLLVMLAALTVGVDAHDIAVFPLVKGPDLHLTVKYGHPGDYSATAAGKLIELTAFDPGGEKQAIAGRLRPEGTSLISAPAPFAASGSGTWVFAASYDNGFFLRTAEGRSVNTTKAEYPAASNVTHNLKYGKALLGSGPGFDRVVGHRLELVPRQDPATLKAGDEITVEVRHEGKPLSGATLLRYTSAETADAVEHKSDASGLVKVALPRSGEHILSVEHGFPSRHPELATRDAYAASLVFTIP
jgi:uncharacterized GH25 family protein